MAELTQRIAYLVCQPSICAMPGMTAARSWPTAYATAGCRGLTMRLRRSWDADHGVLTSGVGAQAARRWNGTTLALGRAKTED